MRLAPDQVFVHGHDAVVQLSGDERGPWRYPLHDHADWCEVVLVQRGTMRQTVNGIEHELGPGDVMLIRADDIHAVEAQRCRFINLAIAHREWHRLQRYLGDDLDLRILDRSADPPRVRLAPPDLTRAQHDLETLFQRQQMPGIRPLLTRVLLQVLPRLMPKVDVDASSCATQTLPAWLAQLLGEAHALAPSLDTRGLARQAGCTPEHLARSMRRHLDTTPSSWLNQQRIERAALLLARSDLPITHVAIDVGLGSSSYLTRLFRARHGCSPQAYRRQHSLTGAIDSHQV